MIGVTEATIDAVLEVTVLPPVSCTVTTGCVVKAIPEREPDPAVVRDNCVGAPVVTVNDCIAVDTPETATFELLSN